MIRFKCVKEVSSGLVYIRSTHTYVKWNRRYIFGGNGACEIAGLVMQAAE